MKVNETAISVVRGSVFEQDVDALVNAANEAMRGGGGIDGRFHDEAGSGLMQELKQVAPKGTKTGTAILTRGHNLKQPFIIHTPGPIWRGGAHSEPEFLANCYHSYLAAADEQQLESIAFCSISTGIYGYPLQLAAPLAVETVINYLNVHLETRLRRVLFAMYGQAEYEVFKAALDAAQTR